jgi:RNA-directed DNA polymerase
MARNRYGEIFTSFLPGVSPQMLKRMREMIWQMTLPLKEIARRLNPILRGWIQYYSKLYPTELRVMLFSYLNQELSPWLRKWHQRLRRHYRRNRGLQAQIAQQHPSLFVHLRGAGVLADG